MVESESPRLTLLPDVHIERQRRALVQRAAAPARQQRSPQRVNWLHLLVLPAITMVAACADASPATLRIEAAKTQVEWGRELTVRVFLDDPRRNLQELDLSAWRQQLSVSSGEVQWQDSVEDSGKADNQVQVMRLRLNALRPGPIILPPLEVSGAYSQALRLDISPSHQDGIELRPTVTLNTRQPWERQQTVVNVIVDSPAAHAVLKVATPLEIPGFEIHPIPLQRDRHGDNTRLTLGWALFPLVAGRYQLTLPALEYRVNGRRSHSWHLPPTPLEVKALPRYLPPTLPVGQLQIDSDLQPDGLLDPAQLAWWNIRISGPLTAAWLPSARPHSPPDGAASILAAEEMLTTETGTNGISASRDQQFPIRAGASGRLELPTVAINWFDPETGQLRRQTINAPPRWVIASHWILLAATLTSLMGIAALGFGVAWARRRLRHRRDHHMALAQVADANTPHALRRALNQLAHVHGSDTNLSLRAWLGHWRQRYEVPAGLEDCLQKLSRQCYRQDGNTPTTLDPTLKQKLLSLLKRPRRI